MPEGSCPARTEDKGRQCDEGARRCDRDGACWVPCMRCCLPEPKAKKHLQRHRCKCLILLPFLVGPGRLELPTNGLRVQLFYLAEFLKSLQINALHRTP